MHRFPTLHPDSTEMTSFVTYVNLNWVSPVKEWVSFNEPKVHGEVSHPIFFGVIERPFESLENESISCFYLRIGFGMFE